MKIKVGNLIIGDGFIPVQTMIKNSLLDLDLTIKKILDLSKCGCDMIRITIPEEKVIHNLKEVLKVSPIPVVADIHFDHRLAILAAEAGVHKIRINPGNIGNEGRVKEVIDCLKDCHIPVRIGINGGSLPSHLKMKYDDNVEMMLEAAREEMRYFEKYGYENIVLSFKSSNVLETIKVNRLAKKEFAFPLHIGITEAGDKHDGTIKNSIGIGTLLLDGIGDTIRVSLTSKEEDEISAGIKILESVGLRKSMIEIISCPTCGRTEVDIGLLVAGMKEKTSSMKLKKPLKIAIMGCVVNGPGEAGNADFGVACGKNSSIIFNKGKKIKTVKNSEILDELLLITKEYHEIDP
jgi:(E)-4-hydroxy-3-methylbut-2-enyl-diphosphate synthase